MKDIVVSGIRSTGNLHLGNYYGALCNFVKMQEESNCYFFIADLHALTTHPRTFLPSIWPQVSTPKSQQSSYKVMFPKYRNYTS